MSRIKKVLDKVLVGTSDANILFDDICKLLDHLGFEKRMKGTSHHIFFKTGIDEILNLQPKGNNAKPYQVKQVRKLIIKYHLGERNE